MLKEKPPTPPQYDERPRPKTRGVFKLLGLLLILAAGWLAWTAYRTGRLPDISDPRQQKELIAQAEKDLESAKAGARVAVNWAEAGFDDLRKRIKGKPPETPEESSALVKESQEDAQVRVLQKDIPTPIAPGDIKATVEETKQNKPAVPPPAIPITRNSPETTSKYGQAYAEAQEHFLRGMAEHARSDPNFPKDVVQKALAAAEPHFVACLNLLEEVRKSGKSGPEIDQLESKAAVRLYDCRKRRSLR